MKIIKVDNYIIANKKYNKYKYPLPSYFYSGIVVLKVTTDCNTISYAEFSPYIIPSIELKKILDSQIYNLIINQKLKDFENLKNKIWKLKLKYTVKSILNAGLSQIYIDAFAKYKKISSYQLIAKTKKNIKPKLYASGGMIFENQKYDKLIDEVFWSIENNFYGWKFRPKTPNSNPSHFQRIYNPPSFNIDEIISFLIKLKKTVDDSFKIIIDFGNRFQKLENLEYFLSFLKEINIFFIEEPIKYNIYYYKKIKKNFKIKISGGENFSKINQIDKAIKGKYFDFIQPDTNLIPIHELYNYFINNKNKDKLIIHNFCLPITTMSNFTLYKSLNLKNLIEYNITFNPLRDEILKENFDSTIPSKFNIKDYGLGVNISNEIIEKYDISTKI